MPKIISVLAAFLCAPVFVTVLMYAASFLVLGPISFPLFIGIEYGWAAWIAALIIYNAVGVGSFYALTYLDKYVDTITKDLNIAIFIWLVVISFSLSISVMNSYH